MSNIHISGDHVTYSDAKLINVVIKHIIENSVTPEILSAKRMEFYMAVMTEIVSILKDEIGEEKWQESLEKAYVNRLYAFINDPTFAFNINSIDNVELKSIAVFILKGYSFKDCVAYLRLNEIEDYRYILALWGCLCGYMEMSKDALSEILTMENYELVYKKVFGTELAEITQATITSFTQEKSIDYNLLHQILEVFKYKESELLIDSISKCNPSEDSIEKYLNDILNSSKHIPLLHLRQYKFRIYPIFYTVRLSIQNMSIAQFRRLSQNHRLSLLFLPTFQSNNLYLFSH